VVWDAVILEAMDLDGIALKSETFSLVGEEVLYIIALISLELDHLAHLRVNNDGAIASKLLLDHLQDLFLVEFLGQTLDGRQSLATIALLNANMYVICRLLAGFSGVLVGFGEGVDSLEIFDI